MTDTKEIRAARESVTEAKENIQVANLEKEISGLDDIMDDLNKKIEDSNKYFDSLIENAEDYWDSLIKGLGDYRSRWQELADIEEQARMEVTLRNLGITTDDVLNMSGSAFESFRGTYLGLLNEMYSGNDEMVNMLQKFGGISTDALRPFTGTLGSVAESLDDFAVHTGNTTAAIQSVSDAMDGVPDVDIINSITQFDALNGSVDNTTASIGGVSKGGSPGGSAQKNTSNTQGKSKGGTDNLIGSVGNLGKTTAATLGEADGDGAIGKFGELGNTIADAKNHVAGINDGLHELDGMTAECVIRINIETVGSVPDVAAGTPLADIGSTYMKSGEFIPKYMGGSYADGTANLNGNGRVAKPKGMAHVEGTALVSGNWAVQSDEQNALVGEVGRELIVRGGRFFTVGDNGAEMFDIKQGDIVFNHEQTEALLKNGHISGRGKAYADGTVGGGRLLTPDGHILRPLQQGDHGYDLMKAFEPLVQKILSGEETIISNAVFDGQKQMERWTKEITNNTAISNVTNNRNVQQPIINGGINITCPGITSQEVARQVGVELNNMFNGLHLDAMRQSMMR